MKSFLALGCLMLVGCAPGLSQSLQPQVGVMTAPQASSKFGPPVSQTKAADGSSTTLVWTPKRYATTDTRYVAPRGPTYGGSASGAHVAPQARSQDRLALLFDRRGILQEWKYQPE